MTKPRLFVFGDSFAFNHFSDKVSNSHFGLDVVKEYAKHYNYFGHWTDHMQNYYDVYSFGMAGAPNEEIVYQLSNLPKYKDGDRMIVILSIPTRIRWIHNKSIHTLVSKTQMLHNGFSKKLVDIIEPQFLERHDLWNSDTITNEKIFLNNIGSLYTKYNPIVTSWFKDTYEQLDNIVPLVSPNYTSITSESNGLYKDRHLGINGNYHMFKDLSKMLGIDTSDYRYTPTTFKKEII